MSSISFRTESNGSVDVRGTERAFMGVVCSDIAGASQVPGTRSDTQRETPMSTEVDATEVDAVWVALLGERHPADSDDDMEWWTYLSTRPEVLTAVMVRLHDERAAVAARWHQDGDSYTDIGARIGLTRARAQQLVDRHRRRVTLPVQERMQ